MHAAKFEATIEGKKSCKANCSWINESDSHIKSFFNRINIHHLFNSSFSYQQLLAQSCSFNLLVETYKTVQM